MAETATMGGTYPTISDFYAGRGILITGATGFIGKAVVEKLLRTCPNLKTVYLLVRPKKDMSTQERVDKLTEEQVFSRLRKEQPDFAQKIVAVNGELVHENMGLSTEDREMLVKNVSVIIHIAATIKFNEKLKTAVDLNVIATRRIVELARKLRECRAVIHTSTAYAHTNREVIDEVVYPPSYDPQKLIELTSLLDGDLADAVTPPILAGRPNTYTFTKSIAESVVAKEGAGLPTAIVRPSIVSASWREPFPGWVDNFNGTCGLSLAVGTGVLRVIQGSEDLKCDIVPVDFVANMLVAVAWYIGVKSAGVPPSDRTCEVFNCTSGNMAPCVWGTWTKHICSTFSKYALEKNVFRRPSLDMYPTDSASYKFWRFFSHTLPGQLVDFVSKMRGKKPHLMRTYEKLATVTSSYTFFLSNEWKWETNRVHELASAMDPADRKNVWVDISNLHWLSFIESHCIGVKKFLMREDMSRLNIARAKQRRLAFISIALKTGLFAAILRFILPYLRKRGFRRSALWLLLPALYVTRQLYI